MEAQEILPQNTIVEIIRTEIAATVSGFGSTDFPMTITVLSLGNPIAQVTTDNNGIFIEEPTVTADFQDTSVVVDALGGMAGAMLETSLVFGTTGPIGMPRNGRHIRVVIRNFPVFPDDDTKGC